MRRLAIMVLAVCFFVLPSWSQTCSNTAVGSFTCVRNATNNTASNSTSVTYTGGYTQGQLIVVGVIANGSNAWVAGNVTNTNAYTWARWGDLLSSASPQHIAIFYTVVPSTTAGSDTITATNSNGAATLTIIDSAIYSDTGGFSIDGLGISNTGNSANISSGAYTVTTGDLNIALGVSGNGSVVAGSGWNNRENETGLGGGPYSMLEDQSAASGSATATFTTASSVWGVIAIAFRIPAANTGGQFISGPMLPQVSANVAYPPDTGYTITPVASGANLQTAITNAACGTKLNLAHDGSWTTAAPYTLPALDVGSNACACHTDPTKYRIIQGDQFEANYTPGVRTDPSAQYHQYPHISSSDANSTFTANAAGSSCWGFAGGDYTETTNNAQDVFGINDLDNQTQANLSHDFAWWGNYIHGQPTLNIKRGIAFNGKNGSIADNYFSDFHYVGVDSNAIVGWDGPGPLYVNNNFLEGATENFLLGGAVPLLPVQTCDVTFTGNHSWKPLAWRRLSTSYEGIHWTVKNAFELKEGCRILVSGNVMEYAWQDGQNGTLFLINQGSAGGIDPQGFLQDVTVTSNVVRNGAFALSFGAFNDSLYQNDHRLSFSNNLWYNLDAYAWGDVGSCCGEAVLVGGKSPGTNFTIFDIWQNHETFAETTSAQTNNAISEGILYSSILNVDLHYGMQTTNSIIPRGFYGGFLGVSVGGGDPVIAAYAPNLVATNNCIYGPGGGQGDTYNNAAFNGKQLIASGLTGVFVNPGTDFHVVASSACHAAASDGLDMGANVTATLATTASVVQTLANVPTVTNVSPSTFTHLGSTSITITGTNFLQESGLGVIVGGAGPTSRINTVTCSVNTCTVVMTDPISLQVNDTVNIPDASGAFNNQGQFLVASFTDTTHWTYTDTGVGTQSWSGGTANRVSPGNACTSVSVTNANTMTCTTPAATGTVTTGPISVFVTQFGIRAQFTGAAYN